MDNKYIVDLRKNAQKRDIDMPDLFVVGFSKDRVEDVVIPKKRYSWYFRFLSIVLTFFMLFSPIMRVQAEEFSDEIVAEKSNLLELPADDFVEDVLVEVNNIDKDANPGLDGGVVLEEELIESTSDVEEESDVLLDDGKIIEIENDEGFISGFDEDVSGEEQDGVLVEDKTETEVVVGDGLIEKEVLDDASIEKEVLLSDIEDPNIGEGSNNEEGGEIKEMVDEVNIITQDNINVSLEDEKVGQALDEGGEEEDVLEESLEEDDVVFQDDGVSEGQDPSLSFGGSSGRSGALENEDEENIEDVNEEDVSEIEGSENSSIEEQENGRASSGQSAAPVQIYIPQIEDEVISEEAVSILDGETVSEEQQPDLTENASNTESSYTFGDKECVLVKDDEFYCVKARPQGSQGVVSDSLASSVNSVFVEKDQSGDKEIFFMDNGQKVQLSENEFEDDAPSFDAVSGLVVWHSLINDRYQIMLHDRNSGRTRQITSTSFNNTNPQIHGNKIVWQGWSDDDWDVFFASVQDGWDLMSDQIEVAQVTENDINDMFPKVRDNVITWQSFVDNSWRVFVYDIETKVSSQIEGSHNGNLESPRFVLLFENRKENGDVEKIGYDVSSGETLELGVTAKDPIEPLPVIPEDPVKDQEGSVPTTQTTNILSKLEQDGGDDGEE